jgi:NitT/TauT family transport system permease protein
VLALPLGFAIGMIPLFNSLFRKYFEALRYLPLPTVSGIFISIFGLAFGMKASFLAFGIFIFALPSVVGKVMDLQNPSNVKDNVFLQTAKTMGMTTGQTFRYVYFPYVMEKVYDDIRSLVAISYTYVVIAESLNKVGGIGAMISTFTRQSRTAEIYALLFIIVLIGLLQDKVFKAMKPLIFPHTRK